MPEATNKPANKQTGTIVPKNTILARVSLLEIRQKTIVAVMNDVYEALDIILWNTNNLRGRKKL